MDTNTPVEPVDDGSARGAEKKEAYHRACEESVQTFAFNRPDNIPSTKKAFVKLHGNDNCNCVVQVINKEGDNNLHYHANMDSTFFVLKGKVKFYGPDDVVLGDFGQNQGLLMPAGARYWFESSTEEEAWLLQVASYPKGRKMSKRINSEAHKNGGVGAVHFDGKTGAMLGRTTVGAKVD
jgi:mannose-6-phosphate isomerase-like protein (cupin superfamily)